MNSLKIGKYEIKHPIIQGGMGVGVSWDKLAGTVSAEGGLGVISAVGTGYYQDKKFSNKLISNRPYEAENFYSKEALFEIIANARKICGDKPLAANILYAINDYGRVVRDACEAGIDIIITGAGLPTNMPEFTFSKYPLDFKYNVIIAITVIPLTKKLAKTYHPNNVLYQCGSTDITQSQDMIDSETIKNTKKKAASLKFLL